MVITLYVKMWCSTIENKIGKNILDSKKIKVAIKGPQWAEDRL